MNLKEIKHERKIDVRTTRTPKITISKDGVVYINTSAARLMGVRLWRGFSLFLNENKGGELYISGKKLADKEREGSIRAGKVAADVYRKVCDIFERKYDEKLIFKVHNMPVDGKYWLLIIEE